MSFFIHLFAECLFLLFNCTSSPLFLSLSLCFFCFDSHFYASVTLHSFADCCCRFCHVLVFGFWVFIRAQLFSSFFAHYTRQTSGSSFVCFQIVSRNMYIYFHLQIDLLKRTTIYFMDVFKVILNFMKIYVCTKGIALGGNVVRAGNRSKWSHFCKIKIQQSMHSVAGWRFCLIAVTCFLFHLPLLYRWCYKENAKTR